MLEGRAATIETGPPTARDLLGPHGPLAAALPGYEVREGQLAMAAAVERALADDGILLAEAGTGTGKTLAYLVPALLSGRKVVISTATRALEEQIAKKDVPLLARVLGIEPRVAVMKGLSNYVCRRRLHEFSRGVESLAPRYARALNVLDEWLLSTASGDLAEVAGLTEDEPLFAHVASSSDTRVGPTCRYHDTCFVTHMRRAAERAQLVIVNHHLFFADLALRGAHPGRVIPDYEAVIFDEAHQLEDSATAFFGIRVSRARVEALLGDARKALERAGSAATLGERRGDAILERVREVAESLWDALRAATPREPRVTLERDAWAGPLHERWLDLDEALAALGALASMVSSRVGTRHPDEEPDAALHADALDVVVRRADALRQALAQIVEGVTGHVVWFEADGHKAALSAAPVDLAATFRARLFDGVSAAVLTSATLATVSAPSTSSPPGLTGAEPAASAFGFIRARLGLDAELPVTELVVPSPFDFEQNALFYTPDDLPPPQDPRFLAAAGERVASLCELTGGGAFVLTTSLRAMHALHRELLARLPALQVFVQGEAPKATLIEAFRAAGDAVLVATQSFWEGVDVPGRALRLVVLEKIPFPVPTDPIVKARSLALETNGQNAFMELHVPAAAIALKQGFGRLIRSRSDTGIVALLDERVHRRGYGKRLFRALPPARRTGELEEVRAFWRTRCPP